MEFDNVIVKAREIFETAYKKTGDVVAAGKQKYDITVLENKLSKNYEALGKLCARALNGGKNIDPEATDALNKKIAERMVRIEELKAEIIAAKNQKCCKNCCSAIDEEAVFCPVCGAKNEE